MTPERAKKKRENPALETPPEAFELAEEAFSYPMGGDEVDGAVAAVINMWEHFAEEKRR